MDLKFSKIFIIFIGLLGVQFSLLGKAADFNVSMSDFYEVGLGKKIQVHGSPNQVYATRAILLDGLQRLIKLNPNYISHLKKRLKSWTVEIHAEMDEEASKVLLEVGGVGGVAISRTFIDNKVSKIYPGRKGFSLSLEFIGSLLQKKMSSSDYSAAIENPELNELIFWNPFAMIPTTLFHEFLHAMDLDNQTSDYHNYRKPYMVHDLVYSCAFGIIGYAPLLTAMSAPEIPSACMACKVAYPEKHYKSGEKISFIIPKFKKSKDANFGNLCGRNADEVMLDLLNRHAAGSFK